VAIADHLPDQSRWQLLDSPLSRVDFVRQPFARPGLAKLGLTLTSPDKSVVEVEESITLTLLNPRRLNVMVTLAPDGSDDGVQCGIAEDAQVRLTCAVPEAGKHRARVYANKERYGTYRSAAVLQVIRR
jgi:hypothetical protein